MGILDWFKNRSPQFDPDPGSEEMIVWAIDKAASLTNPRLKLVHSFQERLAPAVETSIHYLRTIIRALPSAIQVSSAYWSTAPALRAFFVAASDIPSTLGRSHNLRTLFEKFPELEEAHFILGMGFNEQHVLGMSLLGDVVQRDVTQTVIGFSNHQARICGHSDADVRRLLGTQSFEYLVAQALSEIGEERSERHELEANRALIRARLRLFQQHGPGLGTVFGSAPASSERLKLEMQLIENERQMEAIGSPQSSLNNELECLRDVLMHPERYLLIEKRELRVSTMNVVLDEASTDVAYDIAFSLASLKGVPKIQQAFVLARFARSELMSDRVNFDDAERYL